MADPPGRPVISGPETLTEPVSKDVYFLIKPRLPSLPADVQDTTDVLSNIKERGHGTKAGSQPLQGHLGA